MTPRAKVSWRWGLNECVAYVDGNHDYLERFVRTNIPTVKVVKPQGTYLVWIDVSQVSDRINAKQLAAEANKKQPVSSKPLTPEQMVERYFVTNARVQMLAGSWCGYGGVRHVRMNVATSRRTLELALTNIANALRPT